jgi:hypothetical protein
MNAYQVDANNHNFHPTVISPQHDPPIIENRNERIHLQQQYAGMYPVQAWEHHH